MNKNNFITSIKMTLIVLPLLIILIAIVVIGFVSVNGTRESMTNEATENGRILANQIASRIEDSTYTLSIINNSLDNSLLTAANVIIKNKDKLSNDYLNEMKTAFDLYGVYWYDSNAEIIYAYPASDVGWVPDAGHPVDDFYRSGELQFVEEDIRENATAPGEYIKSAYIRIDGGEFIQVSISANQVKEASERFDLQTLMTNLAESDKIVYAHFIDSGLQIIASSVENMPGTISDNEGAVTAAQNGQEFGGIHLDETTGSEVYDTFVPCFIDGNLQGAVNLGISMEDTITATNSAISNIVKIAAVCFVLITLLLSILIGRVVIAINFMKNHLNIIATGDFSMNFPSRFRKRRDELGVVANAIANMQSSIRNIMTDVSRSSGQVFDSSGQIMENSQLSVEMTGQIAKTIEQISSGAIDQAKDTDNGASHMNEFGTLIENNKRNIENIDNFVSEINKLKNEGLLALKDLTDITTENNKSIQEVQEVIMNTNESVDKIRMASQMIEDIASQTNLLALNAAIEAARAGEAGKGFAVVSEEIRTLADQSNMSVHEIHSVIQNLSIQSSHAVETTKQLRVSVDVQAERVKTTNVKFEGISETIDMMKDAMTDLNHSGDTMDNQKDEIVDILENLSAVANENAAGTEEVSATIEEQTKLIEYLQEQSISLENLSKSLQGNVSKFKL